MTDCIFCKVISNEIPSFKVYEDDVFLAILDIHPVNQGHILVLPKEHYNNFLETPAEVVCELAKLVQKLAMSVLKATGAPAFNATINNGTEAGQMIFHTHFHIIPRFAEDGLKSWEHKDYGSGEMEQIGEEIKKHLK